MPPGSKPMERDGERIEITISSRFENIELVQVIAEHLCENAGMDEDGSHWIGMAVREAVANAIKHGNKCDSRKAVHIVADFSVEGVRFIVADEGPGFELEKVPDPTQPCRLLEPSGRGLLLINHIMDEVCFNQSGNRLEMFKRASHKPKR